MSMEGEFEMLAKLCAGLGADAGRARTMADQLMKRADQIATERNIPREEAMRYLLEVLTQGRAGSIAPSYDRVRPPMPPESPPDRTRP